MNDLAQFARSLPPWLILGAGVAAGWLKSFWMAIYRHTVGWLLRKAHISLVVEEPEHPRVYAWLAQWVETKLSARRVTELLLRRRMGSREAEEETAYELIPHYGAYYMRWKKRYLLVANHIKEAEHGGASSDGKFSLEEIFSKPRRTIAISLWMTRDRKLLLEILSEARAIYEAEHKKQLCYYTNNVWGDSWSGFPLIRRPLDTIYLPTGMLEDIVDDFSAFFAAKERYRALGIPWRRGYLLYGPPGGGKTVLVQALSSLYEIPIFYMHLGAVSSASELNSLLMRVESPAIVLIEDVDCIAVARDRYDGGKEGTSAKSLKTGDLLNAMDGIVATEERILILTTNHIERLDEALLRAGRIDRRFHLDYARDGELRRFYERARMHYQLPAWEDFRPRMPYSCTIADAQGEVFETVNNHPRVNSRQLTANS